MKQAGQAVGAAGEVGLVHRDIKPENVLLTRKGQVKIADFGLCRDKEGQHLNLTQTGVTMGTPMYMSPEQVQGHALDHRSDLYSLGVTFYHMLAGFPPYRAETALALALKHVRDTAVSVAVHRSDLPPDLCALVMKLMAKNPADRYASAAEMLKDLSRVKDALNAASVALPLSLPDATGATLPFGSKQSAGGNQATAGAHAVAPKAASQAVRLHLPRVRLSAKTILVAVLISAVVGGVGGWMARADDLLSPKAPVPKSFPGLWMAHWERIPRKGSAIAQYRYAQLEAPAADEQAAWLAVVGRFPGDADSHYRDEAYAQLVRLLFRTNDAERLLVLAGELDHPERKHAERALAPIARAGAAAVGHNVEGVLDLLDSDKLGVASMSDGMAELCLEIVLHAFRTPGTVDRTALLKLSREYMRILKVDFIEPADLVSP
jgi:serine/threonine-protein kinase